MNTKSKGSFLAHVGLDPETDYEAGFYYGYIFDNLDIEIKHNVMALIGKNKAFTRAFGRGAGWKFTNSSDDTKLVLMELCKSNSELATNLCVSIDNHLGKITDKSMKYLTDLAKDDSFFASRLGYEIGYNFYKLTKSMKQIVFDFAYLEPDFAHELGIGIKDILNKLEDTDKKLVLDFADNNNIFASGMTR